MAETTSKKHRQFLEGGMGDKKVSELPGVGPVTAGHLEKAGITKVYHLYGEYLKCDKDIEKFKKFFLSNGFGHEKYAADCFKALKEYDVNFNC